MQGDYFDMKILLTGATGLLGKNIYQRLYSKYKVVGSYNKNTVENMIKLDLENHKELKKILDFIQPDIIVHAAAMTDLNFCEDNPVKAKLINADAVAIIAKWSESNNSKLVYISTDYVFDGENGPYKENSTPAPLQIYGYTKLLGEIAVERFSSNHAIIRVGILHGFNDITDKDTVTMSIINNLKEKKKIKLDNQRIKYPTLIDDISKAIEKIIHENLTGKFHIVGCEPVTRYEWGLKISSKLNISADYLQPDESLFKMGFPKRPKNIKLIDTRANFSISSLDESIDYIFKKMCIDINSFDKR